MGGAELHGRAAEEFAELTGQAQRSEAQLDQIYFYISGYLLAECTSMFMHYYL